MKLFQKRSDQVLGILFLVSLITYLVIFFTCFSELPLNIAPWLQALLLYSHFIPFCLLQLLLCRLARPLWRLAVPLAMLVVPGFVWLCLVDWAALGWVLWAIWCMAPVAGCVLAWLIWAVMCLLGRWRKQKDDSPSL